MTYGDLDLLPFDSKLFYRLIAHSGNISVELIELSIVFSPWVIGLDGNDRRTDGVQCTLQLSSGRAA